MSFLSEDDSLHGRSWVEICEAEMAEEEALLAAQKTANESIEEGELADNSTVESICIADITNKSIEKGELANSSTTECSKMTSIARAAIEKNELRHNSARDIMNVSIEEGEIIDNSMLDSSGTHTTPRKAKQDASGNSDSMRILSYSKVVQGSKTNAGDSKTGAILNDDLSLTSHLDVFHVDSPQKDKDARKTRDEVNLMLDEDTVMFSPRKKEEIPTKNMKRPFMLIDSPVQKSRGRASSFSSIHKIAKSEIGSDVHSTTNDGVETQSNDGTDLGVSSPSSKRELEVNPEIISRRQKQIDYGKNTQGYERYTKVIPKHKRTKDHPKTPPKHLKMSRRTWDGLIKNWRLKLHKWDPISENEECDFENANFDQFSFSSEEPSSYDSSSMKSDSTPSTPKQRTSITESEDGGDQWAARSNGAVKSENSKELWSNCQKKTDKPDDDEFLGCEPLSENCVKACS